VVEVRQRRAFIAGAAIGVVIRSELARRLRHKRAHAAQPAPEQDQGQGEPMDATVRGWRMSAGMLLLLLWLRAFRERAARREARKVNRRWWSW
jgi:hypothetical protein